LPMTLDIEPGDGSAFVKLSAAHAESGSGSDGGGGDSSGSGGGDSSGSDSSGSGAGDNSGSGSSGSGGGDSSGTGSGGSGGRNSGPGREGDDGGNSGPGRGGDEGGNRPGGGDDRGRHHVDPATGAKVEVEGSKIEIVFPDGWKEELENGIYELKDPSGRTVVERPATPEDVARMRDIAM